MPGIYVSYGLEDYERAQRIVFALRVRGYEASWNSSRIPTRLYNREKINSSDLVLTIWSGESAQSPKILATAEEAEKQGKHLGVFIEYGAEPPASFSDKKSISMCGTFPPWEETEFLYKTVGSFVNIEMDERATKFYLEKAEAEEVDWDWWRTVQQDDKVDGYELYLRRFGRAGKSFREARDRLRSLTTRSSRFRRWCGTRFVQLSVVGTTTATFVAIFVAFYPTVPPDTVHRKEFAALEQRGSKLQTELSKSNAKVIALTASLQNSVSVAAHRALEGQVAERDQWLDLARAEVVQISDRLVVMQEVELGHVAVVDRLACDIAVLTFERDRLRATLEGAESNTGRAAATHLDVTCLEPADAQTEVYEIEVIE